MLDVGVRLREVRVLEVAEDGAGRLALRVTTVEGWSVRPVCGADCRWVRDLPTRWGWWVLRWWGGRGAEGAGAGC